MRDVSSSVSERAAAAILAAERAQPLLNAFVDVLDERAARQASELDTTEDQGPLAGIPFAVKDLIDVRGAPTTGGCFAYQNMTAASDARVVQQLVEAGGIPVAKTNLHELGAGATGLISHFGPTRNPWDLERIPGGSSSGSAAAVASGVVPLALGTDTGGSVRIPASFCGITGLKPTPGRVSLDGVLPISLAFDTVGPLARDAALCASAFRAMVVGRPRPVPADPLAGLRVGRPRPYTELLHPDTQRSLDEAASAFEGLGAEVVHLDGPSLDEDASGFGHIWSEFAHHHGTLQGNTDVSSEVSALLRLGAEMHPRAVVSGQRHAAHMAAEMLRFLEGVEVLLVPATPYPAPRAHDHEVEVEGGRLDIHRGGPSRFTYTVNEAGLPAVCFPVGYSKEGLPTGGQLIGRPNADELLLATVDAFQEATDHHLRRPPHCWWRN